MRLRTLFAIAATVYVLGIPCNGNASAYVPLSHRVYDFLERMEHRYFISGVYLGTKPATRSHVARLLIQMNEKKDILTTVEKAEYKCLMDEFRPDIPSRKGLVWDDSGPVEFLPGFLRGFMYRNRRNLFSTSGDYYTLYFDPVIVCSAAISTSKSFPKNDRVYISGNGFVLRGTLGKHVGFYMDVRDSKEWGSRDYPETKVTTTPGRGYVSFKGDRAEFDATEAHITYSNDSFVLSYGRGLNKWGRGKTGTLGLSGHSFSGTDFTSYFLKGKMDTQSLSGYTSPYDLVRFETGFWRLKFTFFTAELEQFPPIAKFYYNSQSGVTSDSVTVKKYMSGHRIEIDFTKRFSMGFYETIVYGGRWDLSYLNPVMFLTGAEHYNGDHDNAVMGLDFRLFVHRSHSVYGEFFIDDISTRKLGTDWYGNKLAYQLGTFIIEPFGIKDIDVRAEYSRIKPWVYTHKFSINAYHHYSDVLGYPTGPNSDVIFVRIRKRFSRRLQTALSLLRHRHGANPVGQNVGGDHLDGFEDGDSTEAVFLDGDSEKSLAADIDLSYELFWQLFLRLGYTYEDRNGKGISMFRFSLGLNE